MALIRALSGSGGGGNSKYEYLGTLPSNGIVNCVTYCNNIQCML